MITFRKLVRYKGMTHVGCNRFSYSNHFLVQTIRPIDHHLGLDHMKVIIRPGARIGHNQGITVRVRPRPRGNIRLKHFEKLQPNQPKELEHVQPIGRGSRAEVDTRGTSPGQCRWIDSRATCIFLCNSSKRQIECCVSQLVS